MIDPVRLAEWERNVDSTKQKEQLNQVAKKKKPEDNKK